MPWSNVPKHLQGKMERCYSAQRSQGKSKSSASAICYSSIVSGGVSQAAKKRRKKGGK